MFEQGGDEWQDLSSSQAFLDSFAIGERTALPTWLESPDSNTQPTLDSSA